MRYVKAGYMDAQKSRFLQQKAFYRYKTVQVSVKSNDLGPFRGAYEQVMGFFSGAISSIATSGPAQAVTNSEAVAGAVESTVSVLSDAKKKISKGMADVLTQVNPNFQIRFEVGIDAFGEELKGLDYKLPIGFGSNRVSPEKQAEMWEEYFEKMAPKLGKIIGVFVAFIALRNGISIALKSLLGGIDKDIKKLERIKAVLETYKNDIADADGDMDILVDAVGGRDVLVTLRSEMIDSLLKVNQSIDKYIDVVPRAAYPITEELDGFIEELASVMNFSDNSRGTNQGKAPKLREWSDLIKELDAIIVLLGTIQQVARQTDKKLRNTISNALLAGTVSSIVSIWAALKFR